MKKIFTLTALAALTTGIYADDYITTTGINIDGTDYALTWGEAQDWTNDDTSYSWWDGTTDTYDLDEGDFALRFTWLNDDDMNYSDVVAEIYDSTPDYWDWTVGDASGWGVLYDSCSMIDFEYYENGVDASFDWIATGSSNSEFGGTYELLMIRVGDILYVMASINRSEEDVVAVYKVTSFGITTAAVTAVLTGNPYFIEDLTLSVGTVEKSNTGITDVQIDTDDDDDAQLYNLAGQKVGTDYKGIVVKNGKKYVAK